MSSLSSLLNPPKVNSNPNDDYKFKNSVHTALQGLTSVSNPSLITNANFATKFGSGVVTNGDGDNAQLSTNWFVVGAANAIYSITATLYPANSSVKSMSQYFEHFVASNYNNTTLYFYQQLPNSVRSLQQDNLTYSLQIFNNQNQIIKVRMDTYSYYDTTNNLMMGFPNYLQPGMNTLSSTTPDPLQSLNGITVGSAPYTEFRLMFLDFPDGSCDLDIYLIKGEVGTLSTPLT